MSQQAGRPAPAAIPARSPRPEMSGKTPDFMAMLLASVDFLEQRKKRPYKPFVPRSLSTRAELATDSEGALPVYTYRRAAALPGRMGTAH